MPLDMNRYFAKIADSGQKVTLRLAGVGDISTTWEALKDEAKLQDREGMVEWLAQKLEDERQEVMTGLFTKHMELIEEYLTLSSRNREMTEQGSPRSGLLREGTQDSETQTERRQTMPPSTPDPSETGQARGTIATINQGDDDTRMQTVIEPRDSRLSNFSHLRNAIHPDKQSQRASQMVAALQGSPSQIEQSPSSQAVGQAKAIFASKIRVSLEVFELVMASMIFANTIVMAFHAQYIGLQIGYELSVRTYTEPADEAWVGGEITFIVLEKIFTVIFTAELLIRFYVHRWKYLRDRWCYIDGTIVLFAWIIFFDNGYINFNVTFIRLTRFTRVLRLLHLLRSREIFDSLKLLVAAIKASVSTLFWSLSVILLIQAVAALGMVQALEPWMKDTANDFHIRRQVFQHFGTFWRASVTMFEITFANWAPSCRLLMDHVSELYGVFYLGYRCVIGFCVLMVVQAVFIQQTMKTTKLDDKHLAALHARQKADFAQRLSNVFRVMDESGDGVLEWGEIAPALESEEMKAMLAVFELEATDFETLFRLLDDGDGQISIDAFVEGIQIVRGTARTIDLLEAKRMIRDVEVKFDKVFGHIANIASKGHGSYVI